MHCRQYRLGAVSAVSRDARIHISRTHCERLKNIFGGVEQIDSKLLYMLSRYIRLVVASTNSALKATVANIAKKTSECENWRTVPHSPHLHSDTYTLKTAHCTVYFSLAELHSPVSFACYTQDAVCFALTVVCKYA